MTIMLTSCKDSITNMELVAIGGFNEICHWLDGLDLGEYKGTSFVSSNLSRVEFDKRTFYYDEDRGYLLGN